jgi:hypothetical protein
MTAISKEAKRRGSFQDSYAFDYALKVTERHTHSRSVLSAHCLFCIYVGREQKSEETRIRQSTTHPKDFKLPFRIELFRKHHEGQHSSIWRRYQSVSEQDKSTFFDDYTVYANTLFAKFQPMQTPLTFEIDAPIVDTIIGDMFFNADDHTSTSHANALRLFKRNDDTGGYKVTRENSLQFGLIVDFIAAGLSFRQVESVLNAFKARTGLAKIGCINDTGIANNARVLCGINLHMISQILNSSRTWAFSLANDGSTHYGRSYFDNRIRIHHHGDIFNVHMLAIPMFERHTADNMYNLISRVLDIICPMWRSKILGIGSDGAPTMTGCIQGVVTQLEQQAEHPIYRIWCGLHQLDLVMKGAYEELLDGGFVKTINAVITHLRAQSKLIADMGQSTCPKLTTRWVAMGAVCDWLLMKQRRLLEHFNSADKYRKHAPPMSLWIVIAMVNTLTKYVNKVFEQLQSDNLLVCQQKVVLEKLAVNICAHTHVEGPLPAETLAELSEDSNSMRGRFIISHKSVIDVIYDQGLFIREIYDNLDDIEQTQIIRTIGNLILSIVDGIIAIQAERDSGNCPTDEMPPVLPHELVKLRTGEFGINILARHLPQLQLTWTEDRIAQIEQDHRELREIHQQDHLFQSRLKECDHKTTFKAGWAMVDGKFSALQDFCGGIATVFANTASVESDFSILGWERDEYCLSLTDLSLEGILQSKQHELLKSLIR